MKKIDVRSLIIGFLLCALMTTTMALRVSEGARNYFGPRGMAAICLAIKDQLNVLRQHPTIVYPEITNEQVLTAIENKFAEIEPFEYETNNIFTNLR